MEAGREQAHKRFAFSGLAMVQKSVPTGVFCTVCKNKARSELRCDNRSFPAAGMTAWGPGRLF